jgi:hypothetical protein
MNYFANKVFVASPGFGSFNSQKVWVPNEEFDTFVLVDDDGNLLAGGLPPLRERVQNYRIMEGSKYSRVADAIAAESR